MRIFIFCLVIFGSSSFAKDVVYLGTEREDYSIRLLQHALSYTTNQNYQTKPLGYYMPKQRAFDLMERAKGLDVMTGSATHERIEKYQAVYFPILRGLNGVRVSLVNAKQPDILKPVYSLSSLKKLVAGQFSTWSDTTIMKQNGLSVAGGTDVKGVYGMLHKQRVDHFPRSVLEVAWDLTTHQYLDIQIDEHVIIQYPSAYYFYVKKGNDELAKAIEFGLNASVNDGSFFNLFESFHGELLAPLKLDKRAVIKLTNPLLPKEALIANKALWYPLSEKALANTERSH